LAWLGLFAYWIDIKFPDYKDSSASAKDSVIPAGMPESRAMDGNYPWRSYLI